MLIFTAGSGAPLRNSLSTLPTLSLPCFIVPTDSLVVDASHSRILHTHLSIHDLLWHVQHDFRVLLLGDPTNSSCPNLLH